MVDGRGQRASGLPEAGELRVPEQGCVPACPLRHAHSPPLLARWGRRGDNVADARVAGRPRRPCTGEGAFTHAARLTGRRQAPGWVWGHGAEQATLVRALFVSR